MKGCQIRGQQEGKQDAAIADDGAYERDDTAYEEYSQKGQQEAGGGEKSGVMEAGVRVVSPYAIGDEDKEGKSHEESHDHKLQGECQVYLLTAHAREGLEEAIEQGIGEDVAQAVPVGLQHRQRDTGIAVEELVLMLSCAQCPGNAIQDIGFVDVQADDEQYDRAKTCKECYATDMSLSCQPDHQGGQQADGEGGSEEYDQTCQQDGLYDPARGPSFCESPVQPIEEPAQHGIDDPFRVDAGGPEQDGRQEQHADAAERVPAKFFIEYTEQGDVSADGKKGKEEGIDIKVVE